MKWSFLALLLVSGCSKCSPSSPVDAGALWAAPRTHSTDLRSVLLTTFPEYRGTVLKSSVARLTRTYVGNEDWERRARELFAHNRVKEIPTGRGVEGQLDAFRIRIVEEGQGATGTIELPIDGDSLGRLYSNPTALSTAHFGLYLLRDNVTIAHEEFEFLLQYDAVSERRAAFLTRQVVELLLGNGQWNMGPLPDGWLPQPLDGGYGGVPEAFTVTLTGVVDAAKLAVQREGRSVTITYRLVTLQR